MKRLQELPLGAYIFGGMAALGLGIAVNGISSCESKQNEAYLKAQVDSMPTRIAAAQADHAELKWQLEKGIITPEEYRAQMNDGPLDSLVKGIKGALTESPTTVPTSQPTTKPSEGSK